MLNYNGMIVGDHDPRQNQSQKSHACDENPGVEEGSLAVCDISVDYKKRESGDQKLRD